MNKGLYIPATAEEVQEVEDLLLIHCGTQMRDFWALGVNIGCRVNELLHMKFSDLYGNLIQVKSPIARHTDNLNYYLTPWPASIDPTLTAYCQPSLSSPRRSVVHCLSTCQDWVCVLVCAGVCWCVLG